MSQSELPHYRCHKEVHAIRIENLTPNQDGTWTMTPVKEDFPTEFVLTAEWVARHKPEVGGYYVLYHDNYKSYSPAKAFEDGYTRIN